MIKTKSALLRAHSRGSLARLLLESEQCNGLLHQSTNKSILYRLLQIGVFVSRLITPISYAFFALVGLYHYFHINELWVLQFLGFPSLDTEKSLFSLSNLSIQQPVYLFFVIWMVLEALFLPYYYLLFRQVLGANRDLQHYCKNQTERMLLVRDCFDALSLAAAGPPEHYIRQVIEGWFLDQPLIKIHYGNFAAWTGWAFHGKDLKDMTETELTENHEIVAYIERMAQWKFPPGFSPDVPPVRLNLDPLFVTQRPFFFYFVIFLVNSCTHLVLRLLGFKLLTKYSDSAQKIYHRPRRLPKSMSSSDQTMYETAKPIVFVHGIGIGFCHYLGLLCMLDTRVDNYLVEWPYVAMQMTIAAPNPQTSVELLVYAMRDTCTHNWRYLSAKASPESQNNETVSENNEFPKMVLVAHSLGSVMSSWILKQPQYAHVIHSVVLLDPVNILLCDPTVASVFVYRDPASCLDLMMHFLLSRELFISHALSRQFSWSHNVLFVEDLYCMRQCCCDHRNARVAQTTTHTAQQQRAPPAATMSRHNSPNTVTSPIPTYLSHSRPASLDTHHSASSAMATTVTTETTPQEAETAWLLHQKLHHQHDHRNTALPRHTVIVSDHDSIVPVASVSRYLAQAIAQNRVKKESLELLAFRGTHGEMMIHPKWVSTIANRIQRHAGLIPWHEVEVTATSEGGGNAEKSEDIGLMN